MKLLALLLLLAGVAHADVTIPGSAPANTDSAVMGTLSLVHADPGEFRVVVRQDNGSAVETGLSRFTQGLQKGQRVLAYGPRKAHRMKANRVQVLAQPLALTAPPKGSLIVILTNFAGRAEPFTQASVQQVSGTVADFYNEASYGKQTLTPTVTVWLQTNLDPTKAPVSNCDYSSIHNAADLAAKAQGYDVAAYANRLYVWPSLNCGWLGLGYVGYGEAYSNGANTLSTYAHELGHNFGLYHAGKLNCAAGIGPSCTVNEYGDPHNVMATSIGHFNAMQKALLQWLPGPQVYTGGTQTYTLTQLESPNATAVKIAENPKRTYWLEYRQARGFDTDSGVFLYVSSPFENVCQTCGNDTLLVASLSSGQTYTDGTITITVGPASGAPPPPPPPPPGAASVDGTKLVDWKGVLTDSLGNQWSLNGSGNSTGTGVTVTKAGTTVRVGVNLSASVLTIKGGTIWGQTRDGTWYIFTVPGPIGYLSGGVQVKQTAGPF